MPHREERLPQHLLGDGVVEQDAVGQGEGRATEAVVELVEGAPVARAHAVEQVGVAGTGPGPPCRTAHVPKVTRAARTGGQPGVQSARKGAQRGTTRPGSTPA